MATISQAPGLLNLEFVRGEDFTFNLDWNLDLTDYTLASFYKSAGSDTENAIAITAVDLNAGQIRLNLTGAQTLALTPGYHYWQLNWIPPSGVKRIVLAGSILAR